MTKKPTGTQNELFRTQKAIHLSMSSQSRAATMVLSVLTRMEFLILGGKASSDIQGKL